MILKAVHLKFSANDMDKYNNYLITFKLQIVLYSAKYANSVTIRLPLLL
jgi:hypothetical protein